MRMYVGAKFSLGSVIMIHLLALGQAKFVYYIFHLGFPNCSCSDWNLLRSFCFDSNLFVWFFCALTVPARTDVYFSAKPSQLQES